MTFNNIHFERREYGVGAATTQEPAFFVDLNLDQIIETVASGLCRLHLASAFRAMQDRHSLSKLVEIQTEINRQLIDEMDKFSRKNDYRFRDEGFGAEGDSWVRAIERLSGAERAVC